MGWGIGGGSAVEIPFGERLLRRSSTTRLRVGVGIPFRVLVGERRVDFQSRRMTRIDVGKMGGAAPQDGDGEGVQ